MCDRPAKGRLLLRSFGVDMNPLVVLRRVGESVDAFLSHFEPFANGDVLTLERFELVYIRYGLARHFTLPSPEYHVRGRH